MISEWQVPLFVDEAIKQKVVVDRKDISDWVASAYIFAREWGHDGIRNWVYNVAMLEKSKLKPAAKYLFGIIDDYSLASQDNPYFALYSARRIRQGEKRPKVLPSLTISKLMWTLGMATSSSEFVTIDEIESYVHMYCMLTLIVDEHPTLDIAREKIEEILDRVIDNKLKAKIQWRVFGVADANLGAQDFTSDYTMWLMSKEAFRKAKR